MFNDDNVHVTHEPRSGLWRASRRKTAIITRTSWESAMTLALRVALKHGVELVVHNDSLRLRPVGGCIQQGRGKEVDHATT